MPAPKGPRAPQFKLAPSMAAPGTVDNKQRQLRGLARWLFERQLCPGEDRIDEIHIEKLSCRRDDFVILTTGDV